MDRPGLEADHGKAYMFRCKPMKACTKCGEVKALDEFPRKASRRDGRASQCKVCTAARDAAYQAANRAANGEKIRAEEAAYRSANRERLRTYQAEYQKANRERIRAGRAAWRAANREKALSYSAKYRAANLEKVRAAGVAYRAANLEKERARLAAYKVANPEKGRADSRRRRALKASLPSEPYTDAEIYERDKGRCQLCSKRVGPFRWPHPQSMAIDHIIPISQGGHDIPANVQLTHFRCNLAKGVKTVPDGEQLRLIG